MIIAFCVVFAILLLLVIQKLWKLRNQPPGPWGIPIFGYLPFLDRKVPYKTLQKLSMKYGPIYSIQLGNINTVVLSDANMVRDFLRRDEFTARAPLFVTHGIMGGYGIICSEGQLWKDQRRQTIDWLKHLGMVKKANLARDSLEAQFLSSIEEFLESIEENLKEKNVIDPFYDLLHSIGNIMSGLVFGITYSKNDSTWKYLQSLQEEGVKYMGVSGVVNFLPFLRFLPSQKRIINFLLEGKARTHHIYDQYISKRQENFKNKSATNILECFLLEKEKRNLASDITVEKFYCQEQLKHLLADLFGAGLDTTLSTIRWFILYMAKYPQYQQILQNELSELPQKNLTLNDLEKCDFLKACISETQRIRPVVPLGLPHGTVKDTVVNGYKIMKNSMIIPLLWAVHMNPNIWKNPDEFNPNRFINDDGKYITLHDFIPFQTGKRMCPGEEFSKMLLIFFIGILYRNYEITLNPKNQSFNFKKI